jgi:hypothetical protein
MKAFLKRAAVLAAMAFAFASPVRANGVSDLWWNPNESGWGVNVVAQSNTLFLTFFVYGQNGQPLWLVAPATKYVSGTTTSGGVIYTGPLYQTSGPFLGGSFNPNAVSVTQVGAVTFTWVTPTSATIAYSVNGTPVSKSLVRQTWDTNYYLPGKFLGGIVLDRTGCTGTSRYESFAQFTVSFTSLASGGGTMQVAFQPSGGGSCSGSGGPYSQDGKLTSFTGTGTSCVSGASGTVTYSVIEANSRGIAGRIDATYPGGCREVGTFGGVWRAE